MSTIELKPCPFCGSSDLWRARPGTLYVECLDCGAFGPGPETWGRTENATNADRAWNERV